MPKRYTIPSTEKLKQFFALYQKHGGNAAAAMRELHPYLTRGSAEVHAHRFLNYIDPRKVVFPRRITNPENKNLPPELIPQMSIIQKASQQVFDALYEKHGANGMKAATKAVEELLPGLSSRKVIQKRALKYLAKSQSIIDMVAALEAQGANSMVVAKKIVDLLNAKTKIRTRINDGDYQEVEELDLTAIDKGISHALKIGVGGGYAPDKSLVGIGEFSLSGVLQKLKERQELKEASKELKEENERPN